MRASHRQYDKRLLDHSQRAVAETSDGSTAPVTRINATSGRSARLSTGSVTGPLEIFAEWATVLSD